ncbi:MAG: hypothetical protein KW788_05185 [Candidatus Doudnabacteria bacterium]|nr:hypothetical protein [Candidatus Doudnabacteria bacterium]
MTNPHRGPADEWIENPGSPGDPNMEKPSWINNTSFSGPIPPQEVRDLVGTAMNEEALQLWWSTPLIVFDNMNPAYKWAMGGKHRQQVIDFINSAKSGDMM